MLTVISSRSFAGKKDPSKVFYVCDLVNDIDGQIAVDVFTDSLYPAGSKVDIMPLIVNHKLVCKPYLVAEKK